MRTSRRIFLKSAVGLTGAATAFHASAASRFLPGQVGKWKLADTKEYLNICCYCSGGCGTSAPSATANSLILKATLTTP